MNGATADIDTWPDPLTIEGKRGGDCFDLTKTQCDSILCPLFDATEPVADGVGRRWTWKMATTDGGPDQKRLPTTTGVDLAQVAHYRNGWPMVRSTCNLKWEQGK